MSDATAVRKDDHLDVCATGDVEPSRNRSLFDDVRLVHCAMPEMSIDDVDLSVSWFGKKLQWPFLITGMTGGTERSGAVNRELAVLAEDCGVALGLGSQRVMIDAADRSNTFRVRDIAKSTVIIGNIGLTQAKLIGVDDLRRAVDSIDADGLAVHLNPGQELTQPEGDRDFRHGYQTIEKLAVAFGSRLLVKETGCGISRDVARRLVECGVTNIDVSGLGGTSWIRVEQLRATHDASAQKSDFDSWGIPTAAAISEVRSAVPQGVQLVASGGVRSGLDGAKALALGANIFGMALPIFRALQQSGVSGARELLRRIRFDLLRAHVLTGAKTPAELQTRRRMINGELKAWIDQIDLSNSIVLEKNA